MKENLSAVDAYKARQQYEERRWICIFVSANRNRSEWEPLQEQLTITTPDHSTVSCTRIGVQPRWSCCSYIIRIRRQAVSKHSLHVQIISTAQPMKHRRNHLPSVKVPAFPLLRRLNHELANSCIAYFSNLPSAAILKITLEVKVSSYTVVFTVPRIFTIFDLLYFTYLALYCLRVVRRQFMSVQPLLTSYGEYKYEGYYNVIQFCGPHVSQLIRV